MRLTLTSALLVAGLLTRSAFAQEQRGAVEGTVQDTQQGGLAGATIVALNLTQRAAVSTVPSSTVIVVGLAGT